MAAHPGDRDRAVSQHRGGPHWAPVVHYMPQPPLADADAASAQITCLWPGAGSLTEGGPGERLHHAAGRDVLLAVLGAQFPGLAEVSRQCRSEEHTSELLSH